MTAKHHLHIAALIPSHIPPESIIAALHDHTNALTIQSLTTSHRKLASTNPETLKDTYWHPPDLHPVSSYEVKEVITMLPYAGSWARREIAFPSCFQDTPTGLKTRADAPAGVLVKAEFRVIKGGADEGEVDGEGEGVGYAEWVLVEDVQVQCAWYMMPFVRRSMEGAHKDICKKIIEKVEMTRMQEELAKTAAKGKGKVDSPTEEASSEGKAEAEALPEKIVYG